MSEFEAKSLCILGRQPALGLAELESLYGAEHLQPLPGAALLDMPADEINFKRLGGTVKVAQLLNILPSSDWKSAYDYLVNNIPGHLKNVPEGTFTLGVSVYGLDVNVRKLGAELLSLKKIIRSSGRSVRIVPNKTLELNSAQVLHNKLTRRGAWELLLVRHGTQTYLGQTLFVQDIDAYAARDQARPKRDARVGMLPPKLAQIIVNLATGPIGQETQSDARLDGAQGAAEQRSEAYKEYDERAVEAVTQRSAKSTGGVVGLARRQAGASRIRLLDPFCGTGVILQEALLMGYHVLGSDIDPRMVEYAQANIKWLVEKYPEIESQVVIETGDATSYKWPRFSAVASEIYLGRPLTSLPEPGKLKEIIQDVNTITKKFLANLSSQLEIGQSVALALPAWKTKNGFVHLPVIDHLTDMGYNRRSFVHVKNSELVYFREGQIVARELLIIDKRFK